MCEREKEREREMSYITTNIKKYKDAKEIYASSLDDEEESSHLQRFDAERKESSWS